MTAIDKPAWLTAMRELHALAQTGLVYARDHYDRERYERIQAIAAEMMGMASGMAPEAIADFLRFNTGYATPKVGVRGVVMRNDRILLVREIDDGLWTMPGGWCEINQTPAECVEREIREESGLVTRATKLLAAIDHRLHHPPHIYHHYVLIFLCDIIGGKIATSAETDAVDFFAEDALPALSPNRTTKSQIELAFRYHRDPHLATGFD
jgi:ADP-ribose pyrophosphatase YjhB (NUDIX family)